MAGLGIGLPAAAGQRFAFRLEVRDVVYTARVERVNGCGSDDLATMDKALRCQAQLSHGAPARCRRSCDVSTKFDGTDPENRHQALERRSPRAKNLVRKT
jgi:hypothetical protein